MAGEMEVLNYNDIDANKMLNKAGLLELSGQIKGYIQANMSSGGSTSSVIQISSNFRSGSQFTWGTDYPELLSAIKDVYDNGLNPLNYIFYLKQGSVRYNYGGCFLAISRLYMDADNNLEIDLSPYMYMNCDIDSAPCIFVLTIRDYGQSTETYRKVVKNSNRSNDIIVSNTSKESSITGYMYHTTVADVLEDIKTNGARKTDIPPIPADPSADGTYVLQNTVSSGTATYSWGTPSGGGGGTTYTAGTGISIENGVISLNLANAEEEEF